MRSAAILVALAGLAIAQDSTSSAASSASTGGTSGCGSAVDAIIDDCLSSTQGQLNACATNDWKCMCDQVTNVLTCYNNCPSDPRRSSVESQQTSWCNAAKAEPSSSSSMGGATSTPTGNVAASISSSMAAASTSALGSPISSGAAQSTQTGGAAPANMAYPGLAAALFGLAALA